MRFARRFTLLPVLALTISLCTTPAVHAATVTNVVTLDDSAGGLFVSEPSTAETASVALFDHLSFDTSLGTLTSVSMTAATLISPVLAPTSFQDAPRPSP